MAYRVRAPTVRTRRGEPVIVIVSLNATEKPRVVVGVKVLFAGPLTEDIEGAVRSIMMVGALTEVGGPVPHEVMD